MTYRVRNIVIAIVFAIVAVTIAVSYATSYKSSVNAKNEPVKVLVAARDIPVGTPGDSLVSDGYVKVISMAKSSLVPDAVTRVATVRGKSVRDQINQGEQVTTRRFASSSVTGVQTELSGTMRAIQLGGDPNQLLAGTLVAGEHVDVIASLARPEGGQTNYTRIIAPNLLVLVAPSKNGGSAIGGGGSTSSSIVLRMTDLQAQAVFHVEQFGKWTLVLRPVAKPSSSNPQIDSNASILRNGG